MDSCVFTGALAVWFSRVRNLLFSWGTVVPMRTTGGRVVNYLFPTVTTETLARNTNSGMRHLLIDVLQIVMARCSYEFLRRENRFKRSVSCDGIGSTVPFSFAGQFPQNSPHSCRRQLVRPTIVAHVTGPLTSAHHSAVHVNIASAFPHPGRRVLLDNAWGPRTISGVLLCRLLLHRNMH